MTQTAASRYITDYISQINFCCECTTRSATTRNANEGVLCDDISCDDISRDDEARDDVGNEEVWNEDAWNDDVWREGVWNGWSDVSESPKPTPPELVQHISLARKYLTPDKADAFEAALRRIHARAKRWEASDRATSVPNRADQPRM